jgi:hypothetical protein
MEPIKKLFQNSFFSEIAQRQRRLESLQRDMSKFFPKELISLVEIKNQIGKTLVVEVKSSVVAHRLKLAENQIINAINTKLGSESLNKIKIRMTIQNKKIDKRLVDSPKPSIKKLKALADKISDSPLKVALQKLIRSK